MQRTTPSLSREEECLATRKPTPSTLVETSVERPLDSFQQERMSGKKKTLSPSNKKECPAKKESPATRRLYTSGKSVWQTKPLPLFPTRTSVKRQKPSLSFRKQRRVSNDHWTPSSGKVYLATRRLSLPQWRSVEQPKPTPLSPSKEECRVTIGLLPAEKSALRPIVLLSTGKGVRRQEPLPLSFDRNEYLEAKRLLPANKHLALHL